MQFRTIRWIALAIVLAGYGIVAAASTVPQFIGGMGVILGSVAWFVWATLHQQTMHPQSNRPLPAPWLTLTMGFVLMLVGLFVFFPTVERLATEQYLMAESLGHQFEDLDGTDGIGIAMVLLYAVSGLPMSLMVGLMGVGYSKFFQKSGMGRYSFATALMLSPLGVGTYTVFHYWWINWALRNGG